MIADDTADPALVACDLLGQAEHDPNSGSLPDLPERGLCSRAIAGRRKATGGAADARDRGACPGATTASSTSPEIAKKRCS